MHFCTSYGPDKSARTHVRTHIHRTKNVTTMSRLPAIAFVVSFLKNKKTFCLFVCVWGGGGEGRGGTRVSIFCYKESNPNLKKKSFFFGVGGGRGVDGGGGGG